ncbi:uncharacterized mitochondrial protein AtMg00310-like [Primulina huaijiensis]|uniref:uncharacterized mitochondrial protein AtMg00310-like n=1 Tax=Primulina huaijiensis TaxID=1492673 RepID=UPI003CC6E4D3
MDNGRKRMHWKTWKALCKPKCLGGMGFRELESFNKALLAKQIWRIMIHPESLVARVLKARYFKHKDILEANLGNNPSFIWRSIIWSRQLIFKGVSWRVGNGKRIQTFRDKWIPSYQTPMHEQGNQEQYKFVSSLIHEGVCETPKIK